MKKSKKKLEKKIDKSKKKLEKKTESQGPKFSGYPSEEISKIRGHWRGHHF